MKRIMIAMSLLVASATALADNPNAKILVCHVGSTLSSADETYMENQDCTPPEGWEGEFTCPDAGKIDLILVPPNAKHIGNATHAYDGIEDYAPLIADAGSNPADFEDNTQPADGIDDGCEAPVTAPKTVFVTSTLHDGSLGGLAGADAVCQGLAAGAGLEGTYKAWLSDSASSPSNRFNKSSLPYQLVDGTTIALDWDDLTDAALLNAISLDEYGAEVAPQPIFTSTGTSGESVTNYKSPGYCSEWYSNSEEFGSISGYNGSTTSGWTHGGGVGCAYPFRLYCFEQ